MLPFWRTKTELKDVIGILESHLSGGQKHDSKCKCFSISAGCVIKQQLANTSIISTLKGDKSGQKKSVTAVYGFSFKSNTYFIFALFYYCVHSLSPLDIVTYSHLNIARLKIPAATYNKSAHISQVTVV